MSNIDGKDEGVITIKRATFIWLLGALFQCFIAIYAYGQLNQRVTDTQQQLDKIESRTNWLYEHAGGK